MTSQRVRRVHADLGTTGTRWGDLWLEDDIHHYGDYYWTSPPTTDSTDYPIVWSGSSYALYRKTDGCNGAGPYTSFSAELGIVVGCTDPITGPLHQAQADIAQLKDEVATLKAQVAALVALLGGKQ